MKFSHQYKKLSWPVFTTIRQNKGYYHAGQTIQIETPNSSFSATIVSVQPIKKANISSEIAWFDAHTTRINLLDMLEKWYSSSYDDYIIITLLNLNYDKLVKGHILE